MNAFLKFDLRRKQKGETRKTKEWDVKHVVPATANFTASTITIGSIQWFSVTKQYVFYPDADFGGCYDTTQLDTIAHFLRIANDYQDVL